MLARWSLILLALLSCANQIGALALTSVEATRMADAKVRSGGKDLRKYNHAPAHYETMDHSWWVDYVRRGQRDTEFSVRVDDKTRESFFVVF